MIKEGKFGIQEAISIITISITGKIFFATPGFVTRSVGTTGWYMTLISCMSAIVFFTFIYLLLKRFPEKNIVEIYDITLGRVIGFIFSFFLMAFLLITSGIYIREFVDVMKVYVFPITPPSLLIGTFVIAVAVIAYLGLETIARSAKLAVYGALAGYLSVLLLSLQYFDTYQLFPILGYGPGKTLMTGLQRTSAYGEIVVLAVFAGSMQGIRHIKKAGYISLILSGLLLSTGLLFFTAVFGYPGTQELPAPIYTLARLIKYGDFIQRLDPVFLFLWNITVIITISVLFYAALSVYCKMFRLQDTRPIILPMSVILFTTAIFPKGFVQVVTVYIQSARIYGNIVFFVLPLIALIAAVLRKKKGEKKRCAEQR